MTRKATQAEISDLFEINKIRPLGKYKNSSTPIRCKCLICNNIIYSRADKVKSFGNQCGHCSGRIGANKKAEEDRPRSRAEAYLVLMPYTHKAVSDTSSTKKVNTTPTKKVESKGPKGVIPGTSTSKSTYIDKDSKPVYTDTSRPNEYFTMTKTKAGQDSLAPYNAQMGLYGNPTKKSGGQTKTKKK